MPELVIAFGAGALGQYKTFIGLTALSVTLSITSLFTTVSDLAEQVQNSAPLPEDIITLLQEKPALRNEIIAELAPVFERIVKDATFEEFCARYPGTTDGYGAACPEKTSKTLENELN